MSTALIMFGYDRPEMFKNMVLNGVSGQTARADHYIAYLDMHTDRSKTKSMVETCKAHHIDFVVRQTNFGCASNIMDGIRDITSSFDRFVVLEDDIRPASRWLESMIIMLDTYSKNVISASDLPNNDYTVGAVGGFPSILSNAAIPGDYDTIMSPRFSCWGWGSWSSVWKIVDNDWRQYKEGIMPFNPLSLSGSAGGDIAQMIVNSSPGQLWDAIVAGSFMHRRMLHAITKYYLVNNDGAARHLSASKLAFMYNNNRIDDRTPVNMCSCFSVEHVNAAVRHYVREMS